MHFGSFHLNSSTLKRSTGGSNKANSTEICEKLTGLRKADLPPSFLPSKTIYRSEEVSCKTDETEGAIRAFEINGNRLTMR